MLQAKKPDDFVIATGETHTVGEFTRAAFAAAGIKDWRKYITIDERYYRPNEVHVLRGRATRAARILSWKPKTKFADLVRLMVKADIANLQ